MKAGALDRMNMVPMHIFLFLGFVDDHLHYYTSQLETLISSKICMLVLKNLNTDLQMKGKAIIKNMFVSPKPTLNIEVGYVGNGK